MAVGLVVAGSGLAQPTPTFTRPGTITVTELTGSASAVAGQQEKPLKVEDRWRAEANFKTARRSTLGLEFGNGIFFKIGSDSEIAVEEFWQQPHSQAGKVAEWKEEPSPSRTLVRLVRGDFTVNVKPLKTARGSTFTLETVAGTLRITQGVLMARAQMTELGIGLCTLELREGIAEFERVGGRATSLAPGKSLVLAIEVDAKSGKVTVSDAPRLEEGKK